MKKRRTWTMKEKNEILAELEATGDIGATAKKYGTQRQNIYLWRKKLHSKPKVFAKKQSLPLKFETDKPSDSLVPQLKLRIKQLEQIVGRQAVELETLKERAEA